MLLGLFTSCPSQADVGSCPSELPFYFRQVEGLLFCLGMWWWTLALCPSSAVNALQIRKTNVLVPSCPPLPELVAVASPASAALPQALGMADRSRCQGPVASTAGNIIPVKTLVTSPCTW